MNPLVIASRLRKLVDPVLIDDHPFGETDFDTFQCLGFLYRTNDAQLTVLPPLQHLRNTHSLWLSQVFAQEILWHAASPLYNRPFRQARPL